MAGQYLTAVFEMRPTKRKAAILERARAQAEALFWKFLEDNETEGTEIANEPDAKVRRGRLQEMKKRLAPQTLIASETGHLRVTPTMSWFAGRSGWI